MSAQVNLLNSNVDDQAIIQKPVGVLGPYSFSSQSDSHETSEIKRVPRLLFSCPKQELSSFLLTNCVINSVNLF